MNIEMDLSVKSVEKAIKELEKYKQSLMNKNDLFVRRLTEEGIPVIDRNIASAQGDSDKTHYTYVELQSFQDHSSATLVVEGEDILYIEFGAGVHYNTPAGTSPHELGEKFGYTIGSYGKGQGANDYWYYVDETGASQRSYGTESTMPVYKASLEIIDSIEKIAKEVFG